LALPCHSIAKTCDAALSDRSAAYTKDYELAGDGVVDQTVRFPAHSTVVVIASEQGINGVLQVSMAGRVVGRADTPISRTGNQRVVVAIGDSTEYVISVSGKEYRELRGHIRLRAVAFSPEESKDVCLEIERTLAAADAAYATGQRVTRRIEVDPKRDAASSYKVAADQYLAAAQQLGAFDPSELQAQSQLAEAAVLYWYIQDKKAARVWAARAESTFSVIHDEYGRARAQLIEAESVIDLAPQPESSGADTAASTSATLKRARATLAGLASFHMARGERDDAAFAVLNIGWAYYMEGQYEPALTAYRRALALYEQLHERPERAKTLQNIALAEYERGRLSQATSYYGQALALLSPGDDPNLYPMFLNNSALANWASGKYDVALRQYGEALGLVREMQDVVDEAWILHNIGSVYYSMGDGPLALEFYDEALRLSSVERDPVGRTAILRTMGNVLREQGSVSEALKMHQEALALASNRTISDQILLQVARDLEALDRSADALERVSLILDSSTASNAVLRARAQLERGRLRILTGDLPGAERDIRGALRTFRTYDLSQDQFDAWLALARLKRRSGDPALALDALNRALALGEELRVQTSNPELRATRLRPLRAAVELKLAMLADEYFTDSADETQRQAIALEALKTAEQARARALADFRDLDLTAPDVPPELVKQRRLIYQELADRRYGLEATLDHVSADDSRVALIRADIVDLRRRLDQIDARIGASSAGMARRVAGPDALNLRALRSDTAVIEYWLTEDLAIAWTVTTEGITMTRLRRASEFDEAARNFLTTLRGFGTVPLAARLDLAKQLSALALQPLRARIAGKRTLLFAPDGALHYVPFAALRVQDSGHEVFLIERHDVAVIPSISTLFSADDHHSHGLATRQMLLVADPVYTADDPRLVARADASAHDRVATNDPPLTLFRGASDRGKLSRLPGTRKEAALIAALLPRESVDRLEGFTATREQFLSAKLGSYRFIHVASHAVADSEIPQASALILSTVDQRSMDIDGRVLAADFMNVRLNADAVVLSGCATALGKHVTGEGLLGLQYVVLARGARTVVSSLWPVADQPAADFMGRFYSSLVRPSSSVLAALGGAMRAMLATPSADPSHWAAFMLTIGELQSGD
jgi:CHAT domain-containing protein/tetratricopeptide (TPR) repeat protein